MNMNDYVFSEEQIDFCFQFRIPYRELREKLRPYLTAEFFYCDKSSVLSMLVDTGADGILLPGDFGKILGIRMDQLERETGNFLYGCTDQYKLSSGMSFCFPDLDPNRKYENKVFFTPRLDGKSFGLLGREVFDRMRFCFDHKDEEVFYIGFND